MSGYSNWRLNEKEIANIERALKIVYFDMLDDPTTYNIENEQAMTEEELFTLSERFAEGLKTNENKD